MPQTKHSAQERLTDAQIAEHCRCLVSHFCGFGNVRANLEVFFAYLARHIPCTRILCLTLDKERQTPLAMAEWVERPELGMHPVSSFRPVSLDLVEQTAGFPAWSPDDESHGVAVSRFDDYARGKRASAFFRLLGAPTQHAALLARLYRDNRRLTLLLLDSPTAAAFKPGHAELLAALCEPLKDIFSWLPALSGRGEIPALPNVELLTSYDLLKRCPTLSHLVRQLEGLAATDATVLVLGESGAGKEVLADSLHLLSGRRRGPLIKVNCAALPETLADSLFFGHEKGSFTGATQTHIGFFEQAHGGTLFLDEVAELSPASQARLLRVLETQAFQRVGGTRTLVSDVRLVAATNRDLKAMVRAGQFREDLFYRLYVYPLTMEPLRRRREDIVPLVQYFYSYLVHTRGMASAPPLTMDQVAELCLHPWPGNVRQLRNVIERGLLESVIASMPYVDFSNALRSDDPSREEAAAPSPGTLKEAGARAITAALRESRGRIQGTHGAATLLGLSPNTLRARMRELGIPLPRELKRREESNA